MAAWQNFLDNFSGQAEFQAQKQGEQLQAEIDYYNSPEGQRAAQIGGGIMAAMLPIPGSKLLGAGRAAKPIIDKMYGAVGKDMVNQGIRNVGSKLPGSSGARVGSDAIGRAPLPVSKAPVQTARGPRGPINVEQPTQLPLRLGGGRNTGGVSETDKAMIDFIKPQTISSKIKELQPNPFIRESGRWKGREAIPVGKGTGQPAPSRGAIPKSYGPRLTEKEGLESLVKVKEGKNWFVDPKTLRTYEFRVGGGTQPRGFYTNSNPPSYVGRAVKDIESNWLKNSGIDRKNFDRRYYERLGPDRRKAHLDRIKAIQDKQKGIMNTPPARSQMEQVGAAKRLEQQTNRRSFLQAERSRLNSMRSQGEATQDDMNKLFKIQEELEAINKLLK